MKTASPKIIDSIVFDLGGVLVDWNPRYLYRKLISDPAEMERFLTEVCHSEWNERQDAGRPFAEGIAERVSRFPEFESWIRAYWERWDEMLQGEITGTVRILERLHEKRTYRLLALSNWSNETFPVALARFPFLRLFEAILLSGREKLIKPDPRFFNLLVSRYGLTPESTVFVDDVPKNVMAARELGYLAVHFTNPEDLWRELQFLGIMNEKQKNT